MASSKCGFNFPALAVQLCLTRTRSFRVSKYNLKILDMHLRASVEADVDACDTPSELVAKVEGMVEWNRYPNPNSIEPSPTSILPS